MWVYKNSEPNLWTVGFYDPGANFIPESDHANREDAAARVHYLNGGTPATHTEPKKKSKR